MTAVKLCTRLTWAFSLKCRSLPLLQRTPVDQETQNWHFSSKWKINTQGILAQLSPKTATDSDPGARESVTQRWVWKAFIWKVERVSKGWALEEEAILPENTLREVVPGVVREAGMSGVSRWKRQMRAHHLCDLDYFFIFFLAHPHPHFFFFFLKLRMT